MIIIPCGNCGTRTSVHSPDCLSNPQKCDRCGETHDSEELDGSFICEYCRLVESIQNGAGPPAEMIADKIESLGRLIFAQPLSRTNATLVRNTLLWVAGHANWEKDVMAKVRGAKP